MAEGADELEPTARALVDEATAGHEKLLSPDKLAELRERLLDELLCTRYGRARVRRAMAAPVVHKSDALPLEPTEGEEDAKKKGHGA